MGQIEWALGRTRGDVVAAARLVAHTPPSWQVRRALLQARGDVVAAARIVMAMAQPSLKRQKTGKAAGKEKETKREGRAVPAWETVSKEGDSGAKEPATYLVMKGGAVQALDEEGNVILTSDEEHEEVERRDEGDNGVGGVHGAGGDEAMTDDDAEGATQEYIDVFLAWKKGKEAGKRLFEKMNIIPGEWKKYIGKRDRWSGRELDVDAIYMAIVKMQQTYEDDDDDDLEYQKFIGSLDHYFRDDDDDTPPWSSGGEITIESLAGQLISEAREVLSLWYERPEEESLHQKGEILKPQLVYYTSKGLARVLSGRTRAEADGLRKGLWTKLEKHGAEGTVNTLTAIQIASYAYHLEHGFEEWKEEKRSRESFEWGRPILRERRVPTTNVDKSVSDLKRAFKNALQGIQKLPDDDWHGDFLRLLRKGETAWDGFLSFSLWDEDNSRWESQRQLYKKFLADANDVLREKLGEVASPTPLKFYRHEIGSMHEQMQGMSTTAGDAAALRTAIDVLSDADNAPEALKEVGKALAKLPRDWELDEVASLVLDYDDMSERDRGNALKRALKSIEVAATRYMEGHAQIRAKWQVLNMWAGQLEGVGVEDIIGVPDDPLGGQINKDVRGFREEIWVPKNPLHTAAMVEANVKGVDASTRAAISMLVRMKDAEVVWMEMAGGKLLPPWFEYDERDKPMDKEGRPSPAEREWLSVWDRVESRLFEARLFRDYYCQTGAFYHVLFEAFKKFVADNDRPPSQNRLEKCVQEYLFSESRDVNTVLKCFEDDEESPLDSDPEDYDAVPPVDLVGEELEALLQESDLDDSDPEDREARLYDREQVLVDPEIGLSDGWEANILSAGVAHLLLILHARNELTYSAQARDDSASAKLFFGKDEGMHINRVLERIPAIRQEALKTRVIARLKRVQGVVPKTQLRLALKRLRGPELSAAELDSIALQLDGVQQQQTHTEAGQRPAREERRSTALGAKAAPARRQQTRTEKRPPALETGHARKKEMTLGDILGVELPPTKREKYLAALEKAQTKYETAPITSNEAPTDQDARMAQIIEDFNILNDKTIGENDRKVQDVYDRWTLR